MSKNKKQQEITKLTNEANQFRGLLKRLQINLIQMKLYGVDTLMPERRVRLLQSEVEIALKKTYQQLQSN